MAQWNAETHNGSAQVSREGEVTLTRTFLHNADDANARPAWAVVGIGINKYDAHPDNPTCLAVEVSSQPVDGQLGWFTLTYVYTNRPFDVGTTDASNGGGGEASPGATDPTVQANPTLRTPTVSYSSNRRMVPFLKDRTGQPVENSAKQPLEGLEVEACTTLINVGFAKGLVDVIQKKKDYQNKVNDANFKIIQAHAAFPKGTLRCNSWDGQYQFEAGYGWYTQCTVEFEFNPEGWKIEALDQGYYETYHDGTQYVNKKIINTRTGMPIDSPAKLNGLGRKLNPGDNPAPPDPPYKVENGGTPNVSVYKTFYPYEEKAFTNVFA